MHRWKTSLRNRTKQQDFLCIYDLIKWDPNNKLPVSRTWSAEACFSRTPWFCKRHNTTTVPEHTVKCCSTKFRDDQRSTEAHLNVCFCTPHSSHLSCKCRWSGEATVEVDVGDPNRKFKKYGGTIKLTNNCKNLSSIVER